MTKLLSRFGRSHPDIGALSLLAEDDLALTSTARAAVHVAGCDECQRRIAEIRDVRVTLRSMAPAEVPRSFRLRRADVEVGASARRRSQGFTLLRFTPAMSALAIMLFVALVAFDVRSERGGSSPNPAASRLAAAPQATLSDSATSAESGAEKSAGPQTFSSDQTQPSPLPTPEAADSARILDPAAAPNDSRYAATAPAAGQEAPLTAPNAAPGTSGSPAASIDRTEAAPAAPPSQPTDAARRDTRAGEGSDRWSGLRITEAVVAALAIITGGIAAVRWKKSREE